MTRAFNADGGEERRRGADALLPEIWAGLECTTNRVGDRFLDQLAYSGHYSRAADVDLLADLGVKAVRYPVLWERHAEGGEAAWAATARSLARLRERGVAPIVGLVHHGSGPSGTSLIDPGFPSGLARFAERVARRFPWVERFTPINEPLTTARFSLLYGLWYPHMRDAGAFAAAMIIQTRATALAMDAIRQVMPKAQLIQTEDLGYTHSTPRLRYQAAYENERRWLTFDLLLGRVTPNHPLWRTLRGGRMRERELMAFVEAPSPPDVIGVNHYLTSERFLDHRRERYPVSTHGGNGIHRYADVEAIRVLASGGVGARELLRSVWERYGLPIAVTEAHLGCSREQQLRWLVECVDVCRSLRCDGVDLRAVTAWSAFGSFDWPSLLTRQEGIYESGLFDVRSRSPRPTALAAYVRSVAQGEPFDHPVLDGAGWWRSERRLLYGSPERDRSAVPELEQSTANGNGCAVHGPQAPRALQAPSIVHPTPGARSSAPRRLAILGSGGTLGQAFARLCTERQLEHVAVPRSSLDVTDSRSVAEFLDEVRPWAVVNAAGFVRVDDAEREAGACRWVNTIGPAVLADRCVTRGVALMTFSSDLVFGGRRNSQFVESDAPAPLGIYGHSKADGERLVREIMPGALVIRTSAFFGEWDDANFLTRTLSSLAMGRRVRAATDLVVSPTYVPDLVGVALDLLIDRESGIWHLANAGALSWADFGALAAGIARVNASRLQGCASAELGFVARRPDYSALASERAALLPPLPDAIVRYVSTRPWERLVRRGPRPRESVPFTPVTPESLTAANSERA